MSESLLSFSEVLLFGRKVKDLEINSAELDALVVATKPLPNFQGHKRVDHIRVGEDDIVLVTGQVDPNTNGRYQVGANPANPWAPQAKVPRGGRVLVEEGREFGRSVWEQTADPPAQEFVLISGGLGYNDLLDRQLGNGACFARIYGFAYEGTYYELPSPTLFLVHGDGTNANELGGTENQPGTLFSRAPNDPSLSGVAAADYQIANDIRVWRYDKADYTIRMDVASGMFEQVLLDLFFEVDLPMMAGAKVSGAKVSGAKVAGAKVAGAKVSGAKVAGAKVSGAKVGGFGD